MPTTRLPALASILVAAPIAWPASAGGVRLDAAEHDLTVNLRTQVQVQAAPYVGDDSRLADPQNPTGEPAIEPGFRIRRARLGVAGDVDGKIAYDLLVDLAPGDGSAGPHLLDALAGWRHRPWLEVWAGVGKTPFSRSALTGSARLALPERPRGVELIAPSRRAGLTVEGERVVRYAAGVYNATPGPAANQADGWLAVGRLEWGRGGTLGREESGFDLGPDVSPRFSLGAGGYFGREAALDATGASADVAFRAWRLGLRAEALWRRAEPRADPDVTPTLPDDSEARAAYLQATLYLCRCLELAARGEWLDDRADVDDQGDALLGTVGLNGYARDGRYRAQLAYTHRQETEAPELSNDVLLLQGQVAF